jgi:hypothetical protein
MATFHKPNEDGPGTYLQLADFKAFWGENWQLALAEIKANLARFAKGDITPEEWVKTINQVSSSHQTLAGLQKTLAKHPTFKPAPIILQRLRADMQKFLPYTPPAGWQVALSQVATAAIQTVAVGAVTGAVIAAASNIGSNALSSVVGADNVESIKSTYDNLEGAIDTAQSFGDAYGSFSSAARAAFVPNTGALPTQIVEAPSEPDAPTDGGGLVLALIAGLGLVLLLEAA